MLAKHKNLIIVPVGAPIDKFIKMHELDFDVNTHWRNASNQRNYDILAIQYSDYVPEDGTYDELRQIKGFKWKHLKALTDIDFTQWDYIGVYDDDVIISSANISTSFDFAKTRSIGAFQISVDAHSESSYPILRQNTDLLWSETNMIEIMCPVFSSANYIKLLSLINTYECKWGWGLDYVFSDLFKCNLGVLHFISMFHPSRPDTGTNVDKSDAFKEMEDLLVNHYPKYNQAPWYASPGRELSIYLK